MPEKGSVARGLARLKPGSPAAYALAAACVGIALLLRSLLAFSLDEVLAFPLFFAAIVFASLFGGLGPGLFAAVIGVATGWFMRYGTLLPADADAAVNFLLGLACAALAAVMVDRHRHLARQSRSQDALHAIVVDELRHRLKNKASTVQAIVALHLREHPDRRDKILKALAALNAADNLVTASDGKGARLADILTEELAPYQPARTKVAGPDIRLPSRLATTLALVLHELVTNAAKYGALSTSMGKILVEWTIVARELKFTWREEGGPEVTSPTRQGFGTRLFGLALGPFQGRLDARFPPGGFCCEITVPLG